MEIIESSSAYLDERVILVQHQSVLTVLQGILDNPGVTELRWLDLACGRGQIIFQLEKNLGENLRSKLKYCGYDGQNDYLKQTEKKANALGFLFVEMHLGNLSSFPVIIGPERSFDLITFTNTVHELAPLAFPMIIVESMLRLSPNGELFIYDMEFLPIKYLELGAVTWRKTEVQEILNTLFDALEIPGYVPTAGQWGHSSCNGWNVQIKRSYMNVDNDHIASHKEHALASAQSAVRSIIGRKLRDSINALESLTKYGPESPSEGGETNRLLYDLWALTRAVEGMR